MCGTSAMKGKDGETVRGEWLLAATAGCFIFVHLLGSTLLDPIFTSASTTKEELQLCEQRGAVPSFFAPSFRSARRTPIRVFFCF